MDPKKRYRRGVVSSRVCCFWYFEVLCQVPSTKTITGCESSEVKVYMLSSFVLICHHFCLTRAHNLLYCPYVVKFQMHYFLSSVRSPVFLHVCSLLAPCTIAYENTLLNLNLQVNPKSVQFFKHKVNVLFVASLVGDDGPEEVRFVVEGLIADHQVARVHHP